MGHTYGSAGPIRSGGIRLASLRRSRRDGAIDLLFLLPMLALLVGLLAYPLASGIAMSLHSARGFELTDFVGLDNYARAILGDAVFHRSLVNTVVFAAAAVVLQIGIGLLLAVLVADARRGGTLLLLVFTAPFVLASVAAGAVWKFLYAPYFGIAPTVGAALGLDTATVAPLADTDTALWAILAAFVWRFAGFTMVVYLAGIRGISRDYYDYAVLEGAGPWRRLRHITWPLLWPQTFALVVLGTIGALRVFDMMWIMTAGGPSHATETVATYVYSTAFRFLDVGYAQAMAMLLLLVIAVLTVVEYRMLNRRAETATQ
jgi:raffinose/stachyose/melibiose transport system permease protein